MDDAVYYYCDVGREIYDREGKLKPSFSDIKKLSASFVFRVDNIEDLLSDNYKRVMSIMSEHSTQQYEKWFISTWVLLLIGYHKELKKCCYSLPTDKNDREKQVACQIRWVWPFLSSVIQEKARQGYTEIVTDYQESLEDAEDSLDRFGKKKPEVLALVKEQEAFDQELYFRPICSFVRDVVRWMGMRLISDYRRMLYYKRYLRSTSGLSVLSWVVFQISPNQLRERVNQILEKLEVRLVLLWYAINNIPIFHGILEPLLLSMRAYVSDVSNRGVFSKVLGVDQEKAYKVVPFYAKFFDQKDKKVMLYLDGVRTICLAIDSQGESSAEHYKKFLDK